MTILDEVKMALGATLANEVCSAQALDEEEDRERVLDEVMMQLKSIANRHANLHNAFASTLDAGQESRVRYEYS